MNHKSNAFHLDIQMHRKNPYGLLRNSYREDGKVKKETIARFTGLSLTQLRAVQAALQNKIIPKDDFKIIHSREYGASRACVELMKSLGLHKIISSRPSDEWVKASLAMIAGRLVYAGSKLSLSHCTSYSALWEVAGIAGEVDVNTHCYEAMDRLLERQDAIQRALAGRHLQDGTLVLYDITSCYMEGAYEDSELVEFGYNRDQKRGHEQIVISLLCASDGCPVAVEVLRGNTKDETTVTDKIEEINRKYGIKTMVFVGDRGMVTQVNYEKINHETTKVISALTHGAIRDLCDREVVQIGMFDERNIVEVTDGNRRYCLCKNPETAKREAAARAALLQKTVEELDRIIACARKTKYSKEMRAGKVVDRYKMGKFIVFEGGGDSLSYTINRGKVASEASLDGCYVVYTDVSPETMTTIQAVENYKSLIHVEQAFRNMKTVQLELRPVFHKTDDRIQCHVFICMLAYYVMWHMKQKLQPLFDGDGEGANRKYTFHAVLEILKSIRQETLEIAGAQSFILTTPTAEQQNILNLLEAKA